MPIKVEPGEPAPDLQQGIETIGRQSSIHVDVNVSKRVTPVAAWIAAFFLLATLVAHLCFREKTSDLPAFDFIDVDGEANLPSWYSSVLLQFCGVIAFVIGNFDVQNQKTGWRGIALILLLMGMDEIAGIHNAPSHRLSEITGISNGYMTNAWVIPASLLCIILAVIYLPFIWRLQPWLRRALIGSAIAYLMGAVGFEILGSKFEYDAGGLEYDGYKLYQYAFEMACG